MSSTKNTLIISTLSLTILGAGAALVGERNSIKPSDYTRDYNQASSIALIQVAGNIQELELEREDGAIIWEVEVLSKDEQRYEIQIDANTGVILKADLDEKGKGGWFGFGDYDDDKQS